MTTTTTPAAPPLALTIRDDDWDPIAPSDHGWDDPWSRILYRPGVTINGVGFHLEGWAVYDADDGTQTACYDDDGLGALHQGVGADGHWDTVTVRGREYVLAMSPYC